MAASSTIIVDITNSTQTGNATSLSAENPYDSYGAMLFIIAVIVVYGVAVIGMLGFYNGKGEQMEDFDKQANRWLKEVEVRQRQLEIKSRKSAFTKRLNELRTDLSHEHVPRLQSHVANYLIASIGMKSRGGGNNVTHQSNAAIGNCGASKANIFSSGKEIERTGDSTSSSCQQVPIIHVSDKSSSNLPESLPVESSAKRGFRTAALLHEDRVEYSSHLYKQHRTSPSATSTSKASERYSPVTGEDSDLISPESIVTQARIKDKNFKKSQKQYHRKISNASREGNTISSTNEETGGLLAEVIVVEYESVL